MKKVLFVIAALITIGAAAQKLPRKKEILQQMQLANSYFMNKWPDAGKPIVTNKERPSNI